MADDEIVTTIKVQVEADGADQLDTIGDKGTKSLKQLEDQANKATAALKATAEQSQASLERAAKSVEQRTSGVISAEQFKANQEQFKKQTEEIIRQRDEQFKKAAIPASPPPPKPPGAPEPPQKTMGEAINAAMARSAGTGLFKDMTEGIARANVPRLPPRPGAEDFIGPVQPPKLPTGPAVSGDAFNQLKSAFGQFEAALGGTGVSFGALNTVMAAAQGGAIALAAAIGGGLLVAMEKAADTANDAASRLGAFTGGLAQGRKAFEGLQDLGRELRVSPQTLTKPFEQLKRLTDELPGKFTTTSLQETLGTVMRGALAEREVPAEKAAAAVEELFKDIREHGLILNEDSFKKFAEVLPKTAEAIAKQFTPAQLATGDIPAGDVIKAIQAASPEIAKNIEENAKQADSIATAWGHLMASGENLAAAAAGGSTFANALNKAAEWADEWAAFIRRQKEQNNAIVQELLDSKNRPDIVPATGPFDRFQPPVPEIPPVSPFARPGIEGTGSQFEGVFGRIGQATGMGEGLPELSDAAKAAAAAVGGLGDAATRAAAAFGDRQKLITGGTAIANRQRADVNLQFIDREQASQAQHNQLNLEKAGLAVEQAHLGAADAAKQMAIASLSGAQAQIAAADAAKQMALALLAPQQAAVALAGAQNQLTTIQQQNKLRRLQEQGIDQGPGTSAEGDLARQRIAQAQRDAQDIAEKQAEVAVEVAKVNLKYAGNEVAKAELAQKRAAIEIKYSYLDEAKAKLGARQAEIAIRSAALEESDTSLKLLKDKALGPIDRDLALLHYQQALLDETKALQWLDPIYRTLQAILEALGKQSDKKTDQEKKPGGEKTPVEEKTPQKFDPTRPLPRNAPPPGPDETDITVNGRKYRVPKSKAPAAPEDNRTELERQQDKPPEPAPAQEKEKIKEFLKKGSGIVPESMTREERLRQQGVEPGARVTTVDPNRPVPPGAPPPAAHETDIDIIKNGIKETFRVLKSDQARGDAARKQMLDELEKKPAAPPPSEPPKPPEIKPPEVSPFTPPPLKPSDVVPQIKDLTDEDKKRFRQTAPPLTEPVPQELPRPPEPIQKPFTAPPLTEPVPQEKPPEEPAKPPVGDKTPELMSQLQGLGTAADTAKTSLEGIGTSVTTATTALDGIGTSVTSATTALIGIGTSVETAKTALDGVGTSTETAKTALDGVGTSVETMKTAMDGVGASVDTMKTSLDGVGTSVETMKTSLDGVGTSVETMKTAMDGVGTSTETAKAALEGVAPAAETAKSALEGAGTAAGTATTALGTAATAASSFASAAEAAAARLASIQGSGSGNRAGVASGGYIRGPGTSTSDSIPAMLSRGEFVVRAAAVQHFGPSLFQALNNLKLPRMPHFSIGGFAGLLSPQLPRYAGGGFVSAENDNAPAAVLGTVNVDLRTDHGNARIVAAVDPVEALSRLATTKRITSTGRKPNFVAG